MYNCIYFIGSKPRATSINYFLFTSNFADLNIFIPYMTSFSHPILKFIKDLLTWTKSLGHSPYEKL